MLKAVTFDLWSSLLRSDSDEPKRAAQGLRSKPQERRHRLWQALNDQEPIPPETVAEACDETDAAFEEARGVDQVTWSLGARLHLILKILDREVPAGVFGEIIKAQEKMELAIPPEPVEGIAETVAILSLRYRLCVIADTVFSPAPSLRRLLELHGLKDYFTGFAFSDEVGRAKPHRAIFEAAADQLGVEPAEMLHVGGSEARDIGGAKALGMKTVLFTTGSGSGRQTSAADALCGSAAELPEIIDRLAAQP